MFRQLTTPTSLLGHGKTQHFVYADWGYLDTAKKRARSSNGETTTRGRDEEMRFVRDGRWTTERLNSSSSRWNPKELDVFVPSVHLPNVQIADPKKEIDSRSTSLDSRNALDREIENTERLWQEGKCSGRGGQVKCKADDQEYSIEMNGLIAT